jgi:site-specific recombinase XerD
MNGQRKNGMNRQDAGLIGRYEAWLRDQGKTDSTAHRYATHVRRAAETMAGGMDGLAAATEEELKMLVAACIHRRVWITTWRPAISFFYRFLIHAELRSDDPVTPSVLDLLTVAQTTRRALQDRTVADFERLRDEVIFTLLTSTDLKPSELRVMAVGCYSRRRSCLNVGPRRRVYLTEDMAKALEEYLACPRGTEDAPVPLSTDSLLFPSLQTDGMLPQSHYWDMVRQALRLAEFGRKTGIRPETEQEEE